MKLPQGRFVTFVLIFLMIGFWVWFFTKAPLTYYQSTVITSYTSVMKSIGKVVDVEGVLQKPIMIDAELDENNKDCGGKPPQHGSQHFFSQLTQDLKQKSRLFVNNDHIYPVWITLFDRETLEPVISFYIQPGKHSKFQIPVGLYEVEVQSGTTWCNYQKGFESPALLDPDAFVHIRPNEIAYIRLSAYGNKPSDMMFSNSESIAPTDVGTEKVQGRGSLVLQNVMGNHYAVHGSINQKPVFFLVDTGATGVSVPQSFAVHAGIQGCKKSMSTTANGVVESCIGKAKELIIGQFVFKDVEVGYSQGMPEDTFLLGMSILSQFKMVQQGEQMVLSR
jgi:aspartyl protease family protein